MANITQKQYSVINQSIRNYRVKIELLNFKLQTVDELSGNVLSGNIDINATSDIRRTCSLELVVTDKSFEIKSGGKIWLNTYIRIWLGIDSLIGGETIWFNKGVFLIDAPSWKYDGATNTLSLQGLDLMAKMTGLRNGFLSGLTTIIPQNSSVRDAIIATIKLAGFDKYVVDECMSGDVIQKVPYEIKIDQGGTVYDILSELRNILPNYEIYFDVDGVFHYNLIPTGKNEPIAVGDDIWDNVVLSEDISTDFSDVKNSIIVYGRSLDPARYATATVSGNNYVVAYANVTSLSDNLLYGFTAPSIISAPYLKVNNLVAYPIVNDDNTVAIIPEPNVYYVVKWDSGRNKFIFLGHQQVIGVTKDENPNSPFYIGGDLGEIRLPLYGDEYDNIVTDNLCLQRAKWELWKHTRLQDKISLNCVPILFLDVNTLVEYTQRDTTAPVQYIVKSISTGLGYNDTMSITMIQYYPFYSTI
ncbi:MAG: hypothetical protein RSF81_07255 [Oscillospiraceae bacterium]